MCTYLMCGSNTSKRMTPFLRVPSRSLCRLLWTQAEYLEITKNYESNWLFRKLCITGKRKLDLDSIYFTALIHLDKKDELFKHKEKIITLKESGLLPYRLELNRFAIEELRIKSNNEMSRAYDALHAVQRCLNIDSFWETYCTNKSVAIVGNAPFSEKFGQIIDSADLVLRFNKFQTKNYEPLVGSKTDVWCRICDIQYDTSRVSKENIKLNILTDNPLNVPVGPQFIIDILNNKKVFYIIPQKLVSSISKHLNAIPSSGARILVSLSEHKSRLNISPIIYGFSFTNNTFNNKRFDHYFEEKEESKERAHSITSEVNLLKTLYGISSKTKN